MHQHNYPNLTNTIKKKHYKDHYCCKDLNNDYQYANQNKFKNINSMNTKPFQINFHQQNYKDDNIKKSICKSHSKQTINNQQKLHKNQRAYTKNNKNCLQTNQFKINYNEYKEKIKNNQIQSKQLTPFQVKLILYDSYFVHQKENLMIFSNKKAHKHTQSSTPFFNQICDDQTLIKIKSQALLTKSLQLCVQKQQLLMKKKLFDPYKYFSKSSQESLQNDKIEDRQTQNLKNRKNVHKRWPSIEQGISVPQSARIHERQLQSMFKVDSQIDKLERQDEQLIHQFDQQYSQLKLKPQINNNFSTKNKDQDIQKQREQDLKVFQQSLKLSIHLNKESIKKQRLTKGQFNYIENCSSLNSIVRKISSLSKKNQYQNQNKFYHSNNNSLKNSVMKLSTTYHTHKKSNPKDCNFESLTTKKDSCQLLKYTPRQSPNRYVKQNKQNYYKIKKNELNQMQKMRVKLKITRKK